MSNLHYIFYVCCPWLDPPLAVLRYVKYFRFIVYVMFPIMGPMEACDGMHVDIIAATPLQRRAQANAPAAWGCLRRVLGFVCE